VACVSLAGLAIAAPSSAIAAQNPRSPLRIEEGNDAIAITAFAGDRGALSAHIDVRARRSVRGFDFIRSDLTRAGGDEKIQREDITLEGKRKIRRGGARRLTLRIKTVPVPGTYRGPVFFVFPHGVRQRLSLVVEVKPFTLAPSVESVRVQVAHCPSVTRFELCDLFRPLMPSRMFDNERHFGLVATPPAPVIIEDVEALLTSSEGDSLSVDVIEPTSPNRIARARLVPLELAIDREEIPPGHYAGALLVHAAGLNEPVRVTLTLDVRREPLLPVLLIAAGVILGRVIRRTRQPRDAPPPAGGPSPARVEAAESTAPEPVKFRQRLRGWARGLAELLSGVRRNYLASGSTWALRVFLALALILGLTAVGFHTLYAKEASTFGAGGLGDYITLVAWGLSADIASRTIATIGTEPRAAQRPAV